MDESTIPTAPTPLTLDGVAATLDSLGATAAASLVRDAISRDAANFERMKKAREREKQHTQEREDLKKDNLELQKNLSRMSSHPEVRAAQAKQLALKAAALMRQAQSLQSQTDQPANEPAKQA